MWFLQLEVQIEHYVDQAAFASIVQPIIEEVTNLYEKSRAVDLFS